MPKPTPGIDTTSGGSVLKRLPPGAPGTQRWLERYGKNLVCVRYRQDNALGRRYTTVELIVDERSYQEAAALVRIAFGETDLRRQARELGGEWIPDRKHVAPSSHGHTSTRPGKAHRRGLPVMDIKAYPLLDRYFHLWRQIAMGGVF